MEEIKEILNKGLEKYESSHKIVGYKKSTIKAIKNCKTEKWERINIYVMNVDMRK